MYYVARFLSVPPFVSYTCDPHGVSASNSQAHLIVTDSRLCIARFRTPIWFPVNRLNRLSLLIKSNRCKINRKFTFLSRICNYRGRNINYMIPFNIIILWLKKKRSLTYCDNNGYVILSRGRHWLYLLEVYNYLPWQITRDNLACNGHENIRDRGSRYRHGLPRRVSRENVKTFRWKCGRMEDAISIITHYVLTFSVRRTPMASSNRWGRSGKIIVEQPSGNVAITEGQPRGRMITPCVQRYINELHATCVCLFVCLLNTRINPIISYSISRFSVFALRLD